MGSCLIYNSVKNVEIFYFIESRRLTFKPAWIQLIQSASHCDICITERDIGCFPCMFYYGNYKISGKIFATFDSCPSKICNKKERCFNIFKIPNKAEFYWINTLHYGTNLIYNTLYIIEVKSTTVHISKKFHHADLYIFILTLMYIFSICTTCTQNHPRQT